MNPVGTKDLLQNNSMGQKAPFLSKTELQPPHRNFGYSLSVAIGFDQKSSLFNSMAYSARGLKYFIFDKICLFAVGSKEEF